MDGTDCWRWKGKGKYELPFGYENWEEDEVEADDGAVDIVKEMHAGEIRSGTLDGDDRRPRASSAADRKLENREGRVDNSWIEEISGRLISNLTLPFLALYIIGISYLISIFSWSRKRINGPGPLDLIGGPAYFI